MSSSMVVLLVLLASLGGLSSLPVPADEPRAAAGPLTPAQQDQSTMSSESILMNFYNMLFPDGYTLPSHKKQFGGDRSDEFLYPPESYYEQWAEDERFKDQTASC